VARRSRAGQHGVVDVADRGAGSVKMLRRRRRPPPRDLLPPHALFPSFSSSFLGTAAAEGDLLGGLGFRDCGCGWCFLYAVPELRSGCGRGFSASMPRRVAASRRLQERGLGFAAQAVKARWKRGRAGGCTLLSRHQVVRAGPTGDASGSRGAGERGSGGYDVLSRGGDEWRRGAERAGHGQLREEERKADKRAPGKGR
jgi:hypothetical protein